MPKGNSSHKTPVFQVVCSFKGRSSRLQICLWEVESIEAPTETIFSKDIHQQNQHQEMMMPTYKKFSNQLYPLAARKRTRKSTYQLYPAARNNQPLQDVNSCTGTSFFVETDLMISYHVMIILEPIAPKSQPKNLIFGKREPSTNLWTSKTGGSCVH